ncbi:hypothetical protein H5410_022075 [Solanum commersonii]|uniref:Uncharacterized protein n=1 Tax=Solanum commersonii TaxID=4109 RepID=A0A9J5ZDR4_SOLCO|nr:hypothetical protein H5410_022075 [Solanum commersonii]
MKVSYIHNRRCPLKLVAEFGPLCRKGIEVTVVCPGPVETPNPRTGSTEMCFLLNVYNNRVISARIPSFGTYPTLTYLHLRKWKQGPLGLSITYRIPSKSDRLPPRKVELEFLGNGFSELDGFFTQWPCLCGSGNTPNSNKHVIVVMRT